MFQFESHFGIVDSLSGERQTDSGASYQPNSLDDHHLLREDFRLISAERSLPIPMNSKRRTVKSKLSLECVRTSRQNRVETTFPLQERDDGRRQLHDLKRDHDRQTNILQKCLAVNKKLLVEKVRRRVEVRLMRNAFLALVNARTKTSATEMHGKSSSTRPIRHPTARSDVRGELDRRHRLH